MLLYLIDWLNQFNSGFGVFRYLTLRAILGVLTALAISFILGPPMIRRLRQYKIGQTVRDDGPQSHLSKAGTPTMGGALMLVAVGISTLLWSNLANVYVWVVLLVTLAFGAIGLVDDYKKLVLRNPRGLAARYKYFWQSVVGLIAAVLALLDRQDAGGDGPADPLSQGCLRATRALVHPADLSGHRRVEQRGQPDGWSGRAGGHAGGAGDGGPGHLRLCLGSR